MIKNLLFSASNSDSCGLQRQNVAPTVSHHGSAANAQFTQGDNISITANASDTDRNNLPKVEFFTENTLLGNRHYNSLTAYAWTNASALEGSSLTAQGNG